MDQIELNPHVARLDERRYHTSHGILTESWSPIGQGGSLLDERVLGDVAVAHGKTPAQVVLRWHVQLGLVPIPKSSRPERLAQNIDVFDFELSNEELDMIAALDGKGDQPTDSDRFGH